MIIYDVFCYKTYCEGFNDKIFFTPENPASYGVENYYYATCLGTWWADMREATWDSDCSTGWQDVEIH